MLYQNLWLKVRFALFLSAIVISSCGVQNEPSSLDALKSGTPSVLFHPVDPTLARIGEALLAATENVDIAMYNMDVTDASPVIQAMKSKAFQGKLKSGALKLRVLFEGYGTDEDNRARSKAIEDLGADVRWMKGGRKVHHKFAVIDSHKSNATVITGSANWSLASMRAYDENIMFWPGFEGLTASYQQEFNLLWSISEEYGKARFTNEYARASEDLETGVAPFFNSANFKVSNGQLVKDRNLPGWTLTRQVVASIDQAKTRIHVASTRIVLRPIYNALLRAAARGVKIDILVNQDQYDFAAIRAKWKMQECQNEYSDACNKDQPFAWFLVKNDYAGKKNVSVRVKFFSLNTRVTLAKQMHSKYMVIDDREAVSGSFNWSFSSEWNHIENMLRIDGKRYPGMIQSFEKNFTFVREQGRKDYKLYIARIEDALDKGVKTDCSFDAMALTYEEIDFLLDAGRRHGKAFKEACK